MTEEQLEKVKFYMCGHASWETEHTLTYESEDGKLGYCVHTPFVDGEPKGRVRIHYRRGTKVYKSYKKFIEALKDFNPMHTLIKEDKQ